MDISRREFIKKMGSGAAAVAAASGLIGGLGTVLPGCAVPGNLFTYTLREKVYPRQQGHKIDPPEDGCYFGIGRVGWGMQNQTEVSDLLKTISASIDSYEKRLGFKPSIVAYQGGFNSWSRQLKIAEAFSLIGVFSVLQFGIPETITFVDGNNEQLLKEFGQSVVRFGEKYGGFFITPMYEMNLPMPWCNIGGCYDPEGFKSAWKYVWDIFQSTGANDYATWTVEFHEFGPKNNWWPGDQMVDWFGLSAYDRHGVQGRMKDLSEFVNPWLGETRDKPMMLQEFGSTRNSIRGTGQAQWLQRAMDYIKDRGIRAALFWDSVNYPLGDDHTISDASYERLKQVLRDPYFVRGKQFHL